MHSVNIFYLSGQHQGPFSDVKEDATVSEGAEHGEKNQIVPYF